MEVYVEKWRLRRDREAVKSRTNLKDNQKVGFLVIFGLPVPGLPCMERIRRPEVRKEVIISV
jgi:hypothetical protein